DRRRLRLRRLRHVPRRAPEHPAACQARLRLPHRGRGHRRRRRADQGPPPGRPAVRAHGDRAERALRRRGRARRHHRQVPHVGAAALRRLLQGRRLARHPEGRPPRGRAAGRGRPAVLPALHRRHVQHPAAQAHHGRARL
ncbi:MAG: Glycerol-3-phosphate cytidylyltransferase, partial [uncultured Frankineae bacterium]